MKEHHDFLRRLPWWIKHALWRLRIIEFRPDCLRGLISWWVSEDAPPSENIRYDRFLSSKEVVLVDSYVRIRAKRKDSHWFYAFNQHP